MLYILSFLPVDNTKWYKSCFRYWCFIFARALCVKIYIHQLNLNPIPKLHILIGNHPSVLEDIGMSALFKVRFLAKVQVKDWWIVGRIGKAAGTLYVDRDSETSRHQAREILLNTLKNNESVGLYPEGGCKGRRIFTPFQYGAFDAAFRAQVPLVPVFLHYEAQEDFEWVGQHLMYKLWQIMVAKNHRANYYQFDAIYPKDFTNVGELHDYIEKLYQEWQNKYLIGIK